LRDVNTKLSEVVSEEHCNDLNLTPPGEGLELHRYKNAKEMTTRGWSGLYWARNNQAGDYEIRALTKKGEGYSYPGGVFSKASFEDTTRRPISFRRNPSLRRGE
jgi:hypothetical protein